MVWSGFGVKLKFPISGPAGKLALDPHGVGLAVARGVEDGAGADIGDDLLGRDLDPHGDRIGAVALAENVLRVIAAERKVVGEGSSRPRRQAQPRSKSD